VSKLEPLEVIQITPEIASLPKADLHLHQEVFPRLERILARQQGRQPYSSPNTLTAHAYDLRHLWTFPAEQQLQWYEQRPRHALGLLEYLRSVPSRSPRQRFALSGSGRNGTRRLLQMPLAARQTTISASCTAAP
jgi:hypothetical protein